MLSWGECRKLANIISICGTSNPFVADVDNDKHVFFFNFSSNRNTAKKIKLANINKHWTLF